MTKEAWLKPIEHLVLAALEDKKRIIGVTAPHGNAGVSEIARMMAEVAAWAGNACVLVVASLPVDNTACDVWRPGAEPVQTIVQKSPEGYDKVVFEATDDTRYLFSSSSVLRGVLSSEFGEKSIVIVDLPPVLDDGSNRLNAVGLAAACDRVFLACVNGQTTRNQASESRDLLQRGGADVGGTIFNSQGELPLGEQIAVELHRALFWIPPVARWVEGRARTSHFLNG